jgi:hypothetical protein
MSGINKLIRRKPSKLVAVVVPMSNRAELSREEMISIRHLEHFLGRYDKYLIIPRSLKIDIPGYEIKRFDDRFFGSAKAHTKLMLSSKFYKAFIDYKFILNYHLDSLVFSDQLTQWCEKGFDFIGSPWIKHERAIYHGRSKLESLVGNGGFSLRNVRSFLKIIYSPRYRIDPSKHWRMYYSTKPKYIKCFNLPKKYLKRIKILNNAKREISEHMENEESFWVLRGMHYYPKFRLPSVEDALPFAFECVPRYCFEQNNYELPFGCHAWQKYDREFWEPYLLE